MAEIVADDRGRPELRHLATELLGHPVGHLELVRRGSAAVFRAPVERVILRVHHIDDLPAVDAALHLASQLAEAGAPVVPPARPASVRADRFVATAWPLGQPVSDDGADDAAALGRTLAGLHAVVPPVDLPAPGVADRIRRRLKELDPTIPGEISGSLHAHAEAALDLLAGLPLNAAAGAVVLHGDAWPGNLVRLDGEHRMIDLDDLCIGPPELDLAPSLVTYRRFHRDSDRWEAFVDGYAGNPDWVLAGQLAVVRESQMNTWLASLWSTSAVARDELRHRVLTWDVDPSQQRPWRTI
ncbi:phosphotransferase [Nocardioides sp. GY 10113]|uniref:phosphotransferase enzyme family protein n=1 Tax=Nocardioides sp. GY 10113 TaxID=2569761 RepID=UPI001458EA8F|nr:phosphotransferase [Nocardioides sp. GY 10113]